MEPAAAKNPTNEDFLKGDFFLEVPEREIPDSQIQMIVVSFKSSSGKKYFAKHVFRHRYGQHIVLNSPHGKASDFAAVCSLITRVYEAKTDGHIINPERNPLSIITSTSSTKKFTQKLIASMVEFFWQKKFQEVAVSIVYCDAIPMRLRKQIPDQAS
jgi:hypothetical protein